MFEFRMPSLGADMVSGTLVAWKVKPGEQVHRGDIVAVVESDKGAIDVEIWEPGTIDALVVAAGAKVPVGTVLATLRTDGATSPQRAAPSAPSAPQATRAPEPAHVRASPAARQKARELGLDLAGLTGTGPSGAVTVADVEHAVATTRSQTPTPAPPKPDQPEPAQPAPAPGVDIRRAIAAAMAKSKREIPHYYLATDIDMSTALAWLEAQNRARSVTERILPAALLIKAVARAAVAFPEMNGFWIDGAHRPSAAVHVGVGVSLRGGGLVAPALHDVDRKGLPDLMHGLSDLITRARAGHLRSSEVADATITVTNMGDQGVETVFGIIYPPQVALVGFGKICEQPRAIGGMLGVRPVVRATLAGDHRASDGHRGGLFLNHIATDLATPEGLQ